MTDELNLGPEVGTTRGALVDMFKPKDIAPELAERKGVLGDFLKDRARELAEGRIADSERPFLQAAAGFFEGISDEGENVTGQLELLERALHLPKKDVLRKAGQSVTNVVTAGNDRGGI